MTHDREFDRARVLAANGRCDWDHRRLAWSDGKTIELELYVEVGRRLADREVIDLGRPVQEIQVFRIDEEVTIRGSGEVDPGRRELGLALDQVNALLY